MCIMLGSGGVGSVVGWRPEVDLARLSLSPSFVQSRPCEGVRRRLVVGVTAQVLAPPRVPSLVLP